MWAGCANMEKTGEEQPCYHINYCSIQGKAAAECRGKKTCSEQKDKSNVAFAVKNKPKNNTTTTMTTFRWGYIYVQMKSQHREQLTEESI